MNSSLPFQTRPRRAACALAAAVALVVVPRPAFAGEAPPRHRGPPPEALLACKDKKADQACAFDGPRGPVEGQCFAPADKPLACRPAGAPPPPRDGAKRD